MEPRNRKAKSRLIDRLTGEGSEGAAIALIGVAVLAVILFGVA